MQGPSTDNRPRGPEQSAQQQLGTQAQHPAGYGHSALPGLAGRAERWSGCGAVTGEDRAVIFEVLSLAVGCPVARWVTSPAGPWAEPQTP